MIEISSNAIHLILLHITSDRLSRLRSYKITVNVSAQDTSDRATGTSNYQATHPETVVPALFTQIKKAGVQGDQKVRSNWVHTPELGHKRIVVFQFAVIINCASHVCNTTGRSVDL